MDSVNENLTRPIIMVVTISIITMFVAGLAVTCLAIGFQEGREYQINRTVAVAK